MRIDSPPPGSVITWGYSKDHRPDLKQFMTELLCVDRGVPIFGRNLDGNFSDKASNNAVLSRISSIMAKHGLGPGAFVYVADSAMVTEANLKAVGPNRFVSRLPATYKECERAIGDAVATKNVSALLAMPLMPSMPSMRASGRTSDDCQKPSQGATDPVPSTRRSKHRRHFTGTHTGPW